MNAVLARPTVIHKPSPLAPAAITPERYVSTDWLATEYERVWGRAWLFACLERDLAEPGDYRVFNIGNESILITRTDAGELAERLRTVQGRLGEFRGRL